MPVISRRAPGGGLGVLLSRAIDSGSGAPVISRGHRGGEEYCYRIIIPEGGEVVCTPALGGR